MLFYIVVHINVNTHDHNDIPDIDRIHRSKIGLSGDTGMKSCHKIIRVGF